MLRWTARALLRVALAFLRNVRVLYLSGLCVAAATLISTEWPGSWPDTLRLVLIGLFAFMGVVAGPSQSSGEPRRAPEGNGVPTVEASASGSRSGWRKGRKATGTAAEATATLWTRRGKPELTERLPEKESFRGREAELKRLVQWHDQLRGQADARQYGPDGNGRGRPLVLLLHGKPGVGKSVVAQELARRLADQYPDGQLYINLGNADDQLSSGEILKSLLDALGWTEPIPEMTEDRARILRTITTGRRMLLILDEAHDHRQVIDVLPNEPRCAAIVTSRRDLGPSFGFASQLLDIPSADDALDMLQSAAQSHDRSLECAIEIVEQCGRLPLALQSAGERVSQEGSELCLVASFLRREDSRLDRLTRGGRNVAEGFATEYRRLEPREQRSLRRLGLVASESFVPWVLCPLLDVSMDEAQDLMDRLYRAQFIDYVSTDPDTGLVRYRLHPLIRLFALAQLEREDPEAVTGAKNRLDLAYESIICQVLAILDPGFRPECQTIDAEWAVTSHELARLIAEHPDAWIRAVYPNLARSARKAFASGEWGLCWRIAARLPAVIPPGPADDIVTVFDLATEAADNDKSLLGAVDVRLAKSAVLIALERYPEAFAELEQALERAGQLEACGADQDGSASLRQAMTYLKMGEAYVQMRCPSLADRQLQKADTLFRRLHRRREQVIIQIIVALNYDTDVEGSDESLARVLGEENRFWLSLERFEERRRRGDWDAALAYLDEAERHCSGDQRRSASLLYRRARLHLEHLRYHRKVQPEKAPPGHCEELVQRAIHRASEAVLLFEAMGNRVGELRARSLLVRALVAGNKLIPATSQLREVENGMTELRIVDSPAYVPLQARALLAKGELRHARGDEQYVDDLMDSKQLFIEVDDGRSQQLVDILLGDGRSVARGEHDGHRPSLEPSW